MDVHRIIGSTGVRFTTVAASLSLVTAVVLREQAIHLGVRDALFFPVVGLAVLVFIGLIHSFQALYSLWLTFAEILQRLVVLLLFGSCYRLIVPWFLLVASVFPTAANSLPVQRLLDPSTPVDVKSLTRMS